jgi:hypothetical protein
MGLARLRTADAGRKTRGLGNASFRSAAIRLSIYGALRYSLGTSATTVPRSRFGSVPEVYRGVVGEGERRRCVRTREERRLPFEGKPFAVQDRSTPSPPLDTEAARCILYGK